MYSFRNITKLCQAIFHDVERSCTVSYETRKIRYIKDAFERAQLQKLDQVETGNSHSFALGKCIIYLEQGQRGRCIDSFLVTGAQGDNLQKMKTVMSTLLISNGC